MRKIIFSISILFSLTLLFVSCDSGKKDETAKYQCPMKCEEEKSYSEMGSCPVCKMDLKKLTERTPDDQVENNEVLETSIFNLTSLWHTQSNETIKFKDLKGDVLVVVMIYTSCQAACPRLVADMRHIHASVDDKSTKYIFVSIDPETDTPDRLKKFAIENKMDNEQWTFLQGTVADVREFSNVLAVKYKQISPLDFSHSNIISLFDRDGVLNYQQEGLGVDNKIIVSKIIALRENIN